MDHLRTELLAPAGTMDSLRAAIHFGADAVYGGMKRFGLRAFAGNFGPEELEEAAGLCHRAGKKFYVTMTIRDFYQDGTRNEVIERHEYGWEEDCSVLRYLDPNRPLDGGMDDGKMKSMAFGQQRGREYRVLKEIYTLPPENERQLADKFIAYFKPHKTKLLRLYYDRAILTWYRRHTPRWLP